MHNLQPFCTKLLRNVSFDSPFLAFTLAFKGSFPLFAIQHFNILDVPQVDVVFLCLKNYMVPYKYENTGNKIIS